VFPVFPQPRGGLEVPGYSTPQLRHAVHVQGGMVRDPMNLGGVPAKDYFDQLRRLNGYRDISQMKRLLGISVD
jgi:hypothetical protein